MKKQAVVGALWTLIDTAGGQILSFVAFLVLARLLVPDDYGIVTLVGAIVAIPSILVNEGFADALVQRENITDDHINAAFWANLGLSLIFVLVLQAIAGWAGWWTGDPLVAPVLRWLSLTLITISLVSIASAIFRRRMLYSTFALRTLISTTAGAMVGTVMAVLGWGIWSLVGLQLVTAGVAVLVLWGGVGWRPKLAFSVSAFRDLVRFVSHLMMANSLRFASEKADVLIIGMVLGARDLGFYYLVTRLLFMINMVTISPIDSVMTPVLSRMQNDGPRLRETYISMICAAAALWIPAVAGLGIVSPLLLPLLFGHKWDDAIPLMMIMSFTFVSGALTRPTQQILTSVGRPDAYAILNVIQLVIIVSAFLVGVKFGLVGAGWAFTAASIIAVPFHMVFVQRAAGIKMLEVLRRYVPVLAAGATMILVVYLVGMSLHLGYWTLLVQAAVGVVLYPMTLYLIAHAETMRLWATIAHVLPARFGGNGVTT